MDTPRIYVASLSDYNAGNLHGAWIEIDKTAEEIQAEINAMLKASKRAGAEEWAIHDFEMPAGIQLSEYESIEKLAALGQAYEQANDSTAFAAWYSSCLATPDPIDTDVDAMIERFENEYRGSADSFKDWVMNDDNDVLGIEQLTQFIKDAESKEYLPGPKNPYSEIVERITQNIDWDRVARDQEHYYTTSRIDGTVYVFSD